MRLNKTTVERIRPPEKGFTLDWDDAVSGFGVRTTANGVKSYVVQARVSGQSRRVTLGRHGVLTADQARARAKTELGHMSQGIDPAATKKAAVKAVARDKALSVTLDQAWLEYRASRRSDGKQRKQSTLDDIEGHLKRNFGDWRKRPITEITPDGVTQRHAAIAKRGPYQADQAMRYLRALLNFARDNHTAPDGTPILPFNPVDALRKRKAWHAAERRENLIERKHLGAVIAGLEKIAHAPDELPVTTASADLVLFLLFTGLRLTEGAALTWADVDDDNSAIILPDPKNRRETTLPLSDEAAAVLARRDRGCAQVFPGRSSEYLKDTRGVRNRIAAETGAVFTNHDLRRTFATIAAELDINSYTLKALLNHAVSNADVTGGYVRPGFERKRDAANQVGAFMRSRADAEGRDNVVTLEARA